MTAPALKHVTDAGAGVVGIGAFFHYMPDIAATLTVAWYIYRAIEALVEKYKNRGR